MRLALELAAARSVGRLSRLAGRGGGTTLPGRVLLRLDSEAIARLGAKLDRGTTIVSATNGKTTTAGMIAALLAADGRRPVHNRAGSNMTWGVATALLEQDGREGLFEVDEAWLPRVAEQLGPSLIVLGNLFRDQLDRYGEVDLTSAITQAVAQRTFGARYLRTFCDQARFARGLGEPPEPVVTGNAAADSLIVQPHDMETYDALFDRDPDDTTK